MKDINPEIEFIFVSAYPDYDLESLSVHRFDFLTTPINEKRLLDSLEASIYKKTKIKDQNATFSRNKSIMIQESKKTMFIPVYSVMFFEKQKYRNEVRIFLNDGTEFSTSKTLSQLENMLPRGYFARTHRSYVVNLNQVIRVREVIERSYEIEFQGTDQVALLSRYNYQKVFEKLKNLRKL